MARFDNAGEPSEAILGALQILLRAYQYAYDSDSEPCNFAIEIERLREIELTNCDLRWLVAKGYVTHLSEKTLAGDVTRSFRLAGAGRFAPDSCFVLTDNGVAWAGHLREVNAPAEECSPNATHPLLTVVDSDRLVPTWDAERQELRFGQHVIKRYRVPSPNQIAVLAAFEEEGWPSRILDPLRPIPEQDTKRRLHDTIKGLNRSQKMNLIVFSGDGSAQGVLWELLAANLPPQVQNGSPHGRAEDPKMGPETRRKRSSLHG